MVIKVVLFDYDGVVNFAPKMFSQRVSQRKPELDLNWEKDLKPFFTQIFPLCKIGQKDLKVELSKIPQHEENPYFKLWGFESVDELLQFWFKEEQYPFDKIMSLIEQLKKRGILCCLATNNEKYIIDYIKKFGAGNKFDIIFSSENLKTMKPQKEFYEKILEELSKREKELHVNEIYYIDDEEENINSAQNLGFQTFHMKDKNSFDLLESEILRNLGGKN